MKEREYHIFEDNGGWYHLAVVEGGECIFWYTGNAYEVTPLVQGRDALIRGECDIWDFDTSSQAENPQEIYVNFLEAMEDLKLRGYPTELRELDEDDIKELQARGRCAPSPGAHFALRACSFPVEIGVSLDTSHTDPRHTGRPPQCSYFGAPGRPACLVPFVAALSWSALERLSFLSSCSGR